MTEVMMAIAMLCYDPNWSSTIHSCQKRLADCVLKKQNGSEGRKLMECISEGKANL